MLTFALTMFLGFATLALAALYSLYASDRTQDALARASLQALTDHYTALPRVRATCTFAYAVRGKEYIVACNRHALLVCSALGGV